MFASARRFLASLALASTLSGCGHMPVSTMVQLRSFDFMTFDPALLRAAVLTPGMIRPKIGTSTLDVTLVIAGRDPKKTEHRFVLAPFLERDEAMLARHRREGDRAHIFRLSEADVERLRDIQRQMREAPRDGQGRNSLSINVSSKACRTAPLPAAPLLTTTLLRTNPEQGYLVLLRDVDLRAELLKVGVNPEAEILPCDEG